jgi:hypothetical protein
MMGSNDGQRRWAATMRLDVRRDEMGRTGAKARKLET